MLNPGCAHLVPRDLRSNWSMTQSTRIYRHSAAGTDWAALLLGAGLGLTLALQATALRAVRRAAEDLGVPKNRFHDEAFAFHSQQ